MTFAEPGDDGAPWHSVGESSSGESTEKSLQSRARLPRRGGRAGLGSGKVLLPEARTGLPDGTIAAQSPNLYA